MAEAKEKLPIIITNLDKLKMPKRKCAYCGDRKDKETMFKTGNQLMAFCNIDCASKYGYKNRQKGADKIHREKKKRLKDNDKSLRTKEAQKAFNVYIRYRDRNDPCISCQRHHSGQYHAGHYKTTGAYPELRFNEYNCHKQCSACNNHLSGNIANYRVNLLDKIGKEKVELLEGPHEPKKYTCEELKEIELTYKQKLKDLKNVL